jgi:hypothetical protein
VYVDKKFVCPMKLSRANWLGSDSYPDAFQIVADKVRSLEPSPFCKLFLNHVHQDIITVTRTDAPGNGWGMNPRVKCCTQ